MRILLLLLTGLFVINKVTAQTSFSTIESKLSISTTNQMGEVICSTPAMVIKFKLNHKLTTMPQGNFLSADSQTVQITPLKVDGPKNDAAWQNLDEQKKLLQAYSSYELDYFKNELHTELINSNNQWVIINSRGWFIWYFKVGQIPIKVARQVKIQLFASTVIGNTILTVNAPVLIEDEFTKAGLIVNELMESLTVVKP
jgi:hypothetical protein